MKILVTGGAGYIGLHIVVELQNVGYEVVVLDNLSNSSLNSLNRVDRITGRSAIFVKGDIRDLALLNKVFAEHKFDGVIHLAGLKAVGESVDEPLNYYSNNVFGSLQLFQAMTNANVKTVVFADACLFYTRERAKLIIDKIASCIYKIPTFMSLDILVVNEEMVQSLKKTHFHENSYNFGMQSTNPGTLDLAGRKAKKAKRKTTKKKAVKKTTKRKATKKKATKRRKRR